MSAGDDGPWVEPDEIGVRLLVFGPPAPDAGLIAQRLDGRRAHNRVLAGRHIAGGKIFRNRVAGKVPVIPVAPPD